MNPQTLETLRDVWARIGIPSGPGWRVIDGVAYYSEDAAATVPPQVPPVESPHMTAREAAAYLRMSYSTFRKKAVLIRQTPGTRTYTREALDEYARSSRPRRKR